MELVTLSNIFGQKITVITGDLIGKKIIKEGAYDKTGLYFIDALLKHLDSPTCLDIGANIGNHTLVMSRHAAAVLAYEPQKKVFEVLQINVSDNNAANVKIFNFGLSNISGVAKMTVVDANNTGATSFVISDKSAPSLDAILRQGDQELFDSGVHHVDFIKVDVEGLEASVFDGLRKTIETSKPIIMMEWNSEETRKGFSDKRLFTTSFADYTFFSLRSTHERPKHPESKLKKTMRKISRRLFRPSLFLGDFSKDGEYGNVVGIPNQKVNLVKEIIN